MEITLIIATDGKQYANLGNSERAKRLAKMMVLAYGGIRYKTLEGDIIYRSDSVWGKDDNGKLEWYRKVTSNAINNGWDK